MGNKQTGSSTRNKQSYRRRGFTTVNDDTSSDSSEDDGIVNLRRSGQLYYDHNIFKVLVVGDACTGKTNFIYTFSGLEFSPVYIATIGIDFSTRTVVLDGKSIRAQMYDAAGQERFHDVVQHQCRAAMGVFIMFDVNDEITFQNVPKWIKFVDNYSIPNIPKMLVGNKCDKRSNHRGKVDYKRAKTFADGLHLPYIETSCKDGTNVEYAFVSMFAMVAKQTRDVRSVVF